jgi:hypothetical protein
MITEGWSGLIVMLLTFAAQQTGEAPLAQPPAITFVEQGEIARIVCGRPCPARAVYLPDRGVLLDASLDPENDAYARSILLHELVHHVQESAARFARLPECCRWAAREREAYAIQTRYLTLARTGIGIRPLVNLTC